MFPLLQLRLASNILRSESKKDEVDTVCEHVIDPSVFSIDNYSAVIPSELSSVPKVSFLKRLHVVASDSDFVISDIPKEAKSIRVFRNTEDLSPLMPGQLGIIDEGTLSRRAYFLEPASNW